MIEYNVLMKSNAGYYIGAAMIETDGEVMPYERYSGYYKTVEALEQDYPNYRTL